jgi:protease I
MKIASVLGPGFEDSEFKDPYDAFRNAGHEVTIVGLEAGAELQAARTNCGLTMRR